MYSVFALFVSGSATAAMVLNCASGWVTCWQQKEFNARRLGI
jgi:hypothetical protein